MSNGKHTKGPWTVKPKGVYGHDENGSDLLIAVTRQPNGFQDSIGSVLPDYDVDEANARLIAAAPELLEALKTAVAGWESDIRSEYDGTGILTRLLDQLEPFKKIISKAEGKP